MRCFVLMGVSGCGKTSVGEALSAEAGLTFIDGDALHPTTNIAKMSRGEPLDDLDRAPWLKIVGEALASNEGRIVIGCSALKKAYRDIIRNHAKEPVHFIHLEAPFEVLAQRVIDREGHFMPTSLLESQFAALEPLTHDETGAQIDIAQPIVSVIAHAQRIVRETAT